MAPTYGAPKIDAIVDVEARNLDRFLGCVPKKHGVLRAPICCLDPVDQSRASIHRTGHRGTVRVRVCLCDRWRCDEACGE